jgi:elongation factor G
MYYFLYFVYPPFDNLKDIKLTLLHILITFTFNTKSDKIIQNNTKLDIIFMPRSNPIHKVRNFGIIAHIDAGKTTTSERILLYTGRSYKIGEVHEGEATMDWMEQEKERGITITAAATVTYWNAPGWVYNDDKDTKTRFNIIDTPGHVDFTVEVERSLRVLDGAVCVFDGVAGVEAQSETVWRQAEKYNVPRICFINKLDRTGANFDFDIKSIKDRLTDNGVVMQLPVGSEENLKGIIDLIKMKAIMYYDEAGKDIREEEIPADLIDLAKEYREKLIERAAENNDQLMEKYLNGEEISNLEIQQAIRLATIQCKLHPIFCGSALKNKGVQPLLDAVCEYLPSPLDIPPTKAHYPDDEEKIIEIKADENVQMSALAFKIASDPFGTLTFFRVYSGTVKKGDELYNPRTRKTERAGRIVLLHSNQREDVDAVYAGEIAAFVGLKEVRTGDTLCSKASPLVLESINFPEPVISIAIEPKTKNDQEKLGIVLGKMIQEDPSLKVATNEETGQTIISGMGELHLEIIVDRMKREYKVETNVGAPQVAYKEAITRSVQVEGKHVKQSGGRGQYGHCVLKVEPLERGVGFKFVNEIVGGAVPREYIPSIQKGCEEVMKNGALAGYPILDVKVSLVDGSYHDVDSSEMAFQLAGREGMKTAILSAGAILLEPVMKVEVRVPDEYMGDVIGDLNSRRGRVMGTEKVGKATVIMAEVPLESLFGYISTLRALTKGTGNVSMEFYKNEPLPKSLQEQVIASRGKGSAVA